MTVPVFYKNFRKLPVEKWLRKAVIKEFNQRPHEKCSNQRADAGHQARQCSHSDTDKVTRNPDEFERKTPFPGNNDWNRIINRDSQVGGHIEG